MLVAGAGIGLFLGIVVLNIIVFATKRSSMSCDVGRCPLVLTRGSPVLNDSIYTILGLFVLLRADL